MHSSNVVCKSQGLKVVWTDNPRADELALLEQHADLVQKMIKLDVFHLLQRIGDAIDDSQPEKGKKAKLGVLSRSSTSKHVEASFVRAVTLTASWLKHDVAAHCCHQ